VCKVEPNCGVPGGANLAIWGVRMVVVRVVSRVACLGRGEWRGEREEGVGEETKRREWRVSLFIARYLVCV
jgi:hypothetical protein